MSKTVDSTRRAIIDFTLNAIEPGAKVLDLGCGSGELMAELQQKKRAHVRGVDINESSILQCLEKGLSVFQGNLDEGLKDYPSKSYDYVILNQTLQMIQDPVALLREMVRVGKRIVVNFPNFAHIQNRMQLFWGGRMPVNKRLPYQWYNTPNIHFCTYKDFQHLAASESLVVEKHLWVNESGRVKLAPNLLASDICLVLSQK